jgi:microcompartment protein CcmL/EutN
MVEFYSIARGIEVADQMLKAANVDLLLSSATCPGKYITLVHGDIAAVESSVNTAVRMGGEFLVDHLIIPNVDEQIFPAITGSSSVDNIRAVGVIESFSIASLIIAADACVKAASVDLLELRIGSGIGGKSYVVMTGDVSDVNAAVKAGVEIIKDTGNIVCHTVIPSPHAGFKKILL